MTIVNLRVYIPFLIVFLFPCQATLLWLEIHCKHVFSPGLVRLVGIVVVPFFTFTFFFSFSPLKFFKVDLLTYVKNIKQFRLSYEGYWICEFKNPSQIFCIHFLGGLFPLTQLHWEHNMGKIFGTLSCERKIANIMFAFDFLLVYIYKVNLIVTVKNDCNGPSLVKEQLIIASNSPSFTFSSPKSL